MKKIALVALLFGSLIALQPPVITADEKIPPAKLEALFDSTFNVIFAAGLFKEAAGIEGFRSYKNLLRGLSGMFYAWATATPHKIVSKYRAIQELKSEDTVDFAVTLTGTAFILACLVKAKFELQRGLVAAAYADIKI